MVGRVNESLGSSTSIQGNIETNATDFTVAIMSDIHQGHYLGNLLPEAIDAAKAAGDLFVLALGDSADTGKTEDFTAVKQAFDDRNMPFRMVLGNHDIYFGGWENWRNLFGSSIFRFDVGQTISFFVLDTANGYVGDSQMNWLENELQKSSLPIKIIATHDPIYMGTTRSLWQLASDEEGAKLKYLAKKYGVKAFLGGHFHGFAENIVDDIFYLVTGGINRTQDGPYKNHFYRMTVTNGTDIRFQRIDL